MYPQKHICLEISAGNGGARMCERTCDPKGMRTEVDIKTLLLTICDTWATGVLCREGKETDLKNKNFFSIATVSPWENRRSLAKIG